MFFIFTFKIFERYTLRIIVSNGRFGQCETCKIVDTPRSHYYSHRNYCPHELIYNKLWVGGIATGMNEAVLRAMDVTQVVMLQGGFSKSLRTRFKHLVGYSEQTIDDRCLIASMLQTVQFVASEILRGQRILLYETVATEKSWIVCGSILRILYPDLAFPSVYSHLNFSQAFVSVNSHSCKENDGRTADLESLDLLRWRLSALARTWIAIARRPAAAKAQWWPPHELILRIAAAIDPLASRTSSFPAASPRPLVAPRPNTSGIDGRAPGPVAPPPADRAAA